MKFDKSLSIITVWYNNDKIGSDLIVVPISDEDKEVHKKACEILEKLQKEYSEDYKKYPNDNHRYPDVAWDVEITEGVLKYYNQEDLLEMRPLSNISSIWVSTENCEK